MRRDLDVSSVSTTPNVRAASSSWRTLADRRRGSPSARQRGGLEHDLALVGVVLGLGQVVDQPPGEDVDELDLGVADDEPPRPTDRDRDLEREPDLRPGRAS